MFFQKLIAAISAFFHLFLPSASTITPSPSPSATPAPTPNYPQQTAYNQALNFQLTYPADVQFTPDSNGNFSSASKYSLRFDLYPQATVDLATILATDLFCLADGPTVSVACQNTAVKPFTNYANSSGYLVRRTKTITGNTPQAGTYQDTAYVFPVHSSLAPAVILSVENPSPKNLSILADIANWFTALP